MSKNEVHQFDLELFKKLLSCNATPSDEDEVAIVLSQFWKNAGWEVSSLQRYAIIAKPQLIDESKPTILVTAHMDSPGFIVQAITEEGADLASLGGIGFFDETVPIRIKTDTGDYKAKLFCNDARSYYIEEKNIPLRQGDRACYDVEPQIIDDEILSPFIDNRAGCFLLAELAKSFADQSTIPYNLILAATALEEFTGFGAKVLARHLDLDGVICLDATYTDEVQNILLGKGPVLTLSDASVFIAPRVRDVIQKFFKDNNLPLQTEVYNFSGTDAKAFPDQGLTAPVLSLLIPSEGNHKPQEKATITDLNSLYQAVVAIISQQHEIFDAFKFPI